MSLNGRLAYVSVSRTRHDGQLFTNDRETLNTALENNIPTKVAWAAKGVRRQVGPQLC